MPLNNFVEIIRALRLVGELLEARGEKLRIVVIGGAAMNLQGFVSRATRDVDILAFASEDATGAVRLQPPSEPLPPALRAAIEAVALDLNLDPHWLNSGPASQWQTGLPPGLEARVHWTAVYGGLTVGQADRYDLIFFKLYAAADDTGPRSIHFTDLLALRPSSEELEAARRWIVEQDPSPAFATTVATVVRHAQGRSHDAQ